MSFEKYSPFPASSICSNNVEVKLLSGDAGWPLIWWIFQKESHPKCPKWVLRIFSANSDTPTSGCRHFVFQYFSGPHPR